MSRCQRFVLLWHELPKTADRPSHFDLMLEREDGLQTWALPAIPAAGSSVEVIELALHRKRYLHYEGPISGDRGSVQKQDHGTYQRLDTTEAQWDVILEGQSNRKRLLLQQQEHQRWLMTRLADPAS